MSFPVNGYNQADPRAYYEQGYTEGGAAGYGKGYNEGAYAGYSQGYVNGASATKDQFMARQANRKRGFSIFNAAGHFIKGAVINPIKSLLSIGGLASMAIAGGVVCAFGAPAALGLAALGVGLGGLQLARGGFNFISNYFKGNMSAAEQSFEDIGGGGVTAFLSGRAFSAIGKALSFKPFSAEGSVKLPFIGEGSKLDPKAFTQLIQQGKQNFMGNFDSLRQLNFSKVGNQISTQARGFWIQTRRGFRDVGRMYSADKGVKANTPTLDKIIGSAKKAPYTTQASLYAGQAGVVSNTDAYAGDTYGQAM